MSKKAESEKLGWLSERVDDLKAQRDHEGLALVKQVIKTVQLGFEERPDVLVEDLRRRGEHRLALMARGMRFQVDMTRNYRAAMERIREFLPEFDDPRNAAFDERACYLRHVACVLSHIDSVGYRDKVHGIALAVLGVVEPEGCCAGHARLDLANECVDKGDLAGAEPHLRVVEEVNGDSLASGVASLRFRLDLLRHDFDAAESRLDWLESRPSKETKPERLADEAARHLSRRAVLARHREDYDAAVQSMTKALHVHPRCPSPLHVCPSLIEALLNADLDEAARPILETATGRATQMGMARTEVQLRLLWLRLLERRGDVAMRSAVAEPLHDAASRLASTDLLPAVQSALGGPRPPMTPQELP